MSLANIFQSCAICRSFVPPVRHLCSYCWKTIESAFLPPQDVFRLEKTHCHLRLFDWHEDNAAFVGPFLHSLKRRKAPFVFRRLAREIFARFAHMPFWPQKLRPVFIPAPPSDPSRPNHALELAEALSSGFGGEVRPLLKRSVLLVQKKKSRVERSQIQIELKPGAQAFLDERKSAFIFTDDVLTTGWTARKAFQALNKPSNFVICTLALRRLSVDQEQTTAKRISLFLRQNRGAAPAWFLRRIRRGGLHRKIFAGRRRAPDLKREAIE